MTLDPDHIDWSATGAMLAALIALVALWYARRAANASLVEPGAPARPALSVGDTALLTSRTVKVHVSGRGTLATAYSGRDNAFNFLRLVFAFAVLFGHTRVLGYGLGGNPLDIPLDLGGLAVSGFFALSGFLITRSGRRTQFLRYWWHRILRIFPGYWVCLLVTAFLVGPLLWHHRYGNLHGYFSIMDIGPFDYFWQNITTDQGQLRIGDVLSNRPNAALNGSLWTLKYELICYIGIGFLALTAVLRRARVVVLVLTLAGLSATIYDTVKSPTEAGPIPFLSVSQDSVFTLPGAGPFLTWYLIMLTTAFLLGACADLYREYIPVNDILGVVSLVLVWAAIHWGLPVLGPALLAYVYLLLWLGIRLPPLFRKVGRRNDYSYGVYIYAFLVQQTIATSRIPSYGLPVYLAACVVGTLAAAMLSWHLIEKPALRLKDWAPFSGGVGFAPPADVPPAASPAQPAGSPAVERTPEVRSR